jgi:hypothetical protein
MPCVSYEQQAPSFAPHMICVRVRASSTSPGRSAILQARSRAPARGPRTEAIVRAHAAFAAHADGACAPTPAARVHTRARHTGAQETLGAGPQGGSRSAPLSTLPYDFVSDAFYISLIEAVQGPHPRTAHIQMGLVTIRPTCHAPSPPAHPPAHPTPPPPPTTPRERTSLPTRASAARVRRGRPGRQVGCRAGIAAGLPFCLRQRTPSRSTRTLGPPHSGATA